MKSQASLSFEELSCLYEFPFEAIFDVPEAKQEFQIFLKKEHNEDPFFFFEETEDFKRLKFQENKTKKAITLFETFILPNSPKEINISSQHRQTIIQRFSDTCQLLDQKHLLVGENVFDEVQLSVFYNLKSDNYPRFTMSDQFKNFLKNKDWEFISKIAVKKSTKYMEYIPKFDGLLIDRDIKFLSYMAFSGETDVWDEIKVSKDGLRASYISKKEFQFSDSPNPTIGKLFKQEFILPATKEQSFLVFSHTPLRKEIMTVDGMNQIDYIPISKNNKYAQSLIHLYVGMGEMSWILKPRDAVLAVTSVMDTKRNCLVIAKKSTETVSMPEKKSHVRASMLTSAFFSDCSPNERIVSVKKSTFKKSSSGSVLKRENSSSSSLSSSSSSTSSSPNDIQNGDETKYTKLKLLLFIDIKALNSDFIKKKIVYKKNKLTYEAFLRSIREQREYGFTRPKFSEGLLETFDEFKSTYLSETSPMEMTWDLEEENVLNHPLLN